MSATASSTGEVLVHRSRPAIGLLLLVIAQAVGFSGYLLIHLDIDGSLPRAWPYVLAAWFGLGLATHVVDRVLGLHERAAGTDPDDRPDPERARRVLTCPPRH